MSDTLGSVIKECNPPKDSGATSGTTSSKGVSSSSGSKFNQENFTQKKEQRTQDRVIAWKSKSRK
jgi:hypothetical protein